VRASWRQYHRATKSYEIQRASVKLAERRVENTLLLIEEDRGTTRDMLDAREDLLRAQNALIEELVSYKLASLALARDMGILIVGKDGQLEENFDAYE